MAVFETSKSAKLDFTENLSGRKIAKFPNFAPVVVGVSTTVVQKSVGPTTRDFTNNQN